MVSIEELKLGNETLEALKYLLLNVSELEGELKTIDMEELRQNNILIKKNLAETKETLETIKPLEQKAQNVFNELAKTQEKLTELDALRKKIENLSALGLVNDTLVDTDHTYSSSKINKLIENTSLSTTTSLQSFVSNELKTSSDNLESKYATLSQSISTLQSSLSSGLSNADGKFTLKTDFEAHKQDADNKFTLKTDFEAHKQDADNKFTLKTDFENYKDTDGYTKLPNGLIIQWGRVGKYPPNATKIKEILNFPITFPNQCLSIASHINDNAIGDDAHASEADQNRNVYVKTNDITKSGFIYTMHTPVENTGLGWEFRWIAIGY